jgi:hypothetical protein
MWARPALGCRPVTPESFSMSADHLCAGRGDFRCARSLDSALHRETILSLVCPSPRPSGSLGLVEQVSEAVPIFSWRGHVPDLEGPSEPSRRDGNPRGKVPWEQLGNLTSAPFGGFNIFHRTFRRNWVRVLTCAVSRRAALTRTTGVSCEDRHTSNARAFGFMHGRRRRRCSIKRDDWVPRDVTDGAYRVTNTASNDLCPHRISNGNARADDDAESSRSRPST